MRHLRAQVIPNYERAEGLISVTIVRRTLVAYCEFAVISAWRSERAMTSFIEYETNMTDASEINRARCHELSPLPEPYHRLQNPEPYPVHFSREPEALLEDLRHGLIQPAGKKGA